MIVWTGHGYLVAVFVFGAALICNFAFDALWGDGFYSAHKWTIAVAMFIAAILSAGVGYVLRQRTAKVVIDKETGEEIVLDRASHTLFFIPMHLWGPILAAIGLALCVMEFVQ